jgi:hypothetical protein
MSVLARFGVRIHLTQVNGQPGVMAIDAQDRLVGVMALDIADNRIRTIHSIVNPDKLRHFNRIDNLGVPLRARGVAD